jgi:hypothetical protein
MPRSSIHAFPNMVYHTGDGLAVLFGEACAGAGDAFQFGEDEIQRPSGNEHRGAVHDVLARRPLVNVASGVFGDFGDRCG